MVKRALKNKPKWKPSKGYTYIEDLPIGSMFSTSNGTEGILLSTNIAASTVLVTKSAYIQEESDERYYLGRQRWTTKVEVKKIPYN